MSFPARLDIPDAVLEIARTLEEAGHEVWCVGGALRDALLRNPHADYDFATSARPAEVQRLFPRTAPARTTATSTPTDRPASGTSSARSPRWTARSAASAGRSRPSA